jgi:hypothetical protein
MDELFPVCLGMAVGALLWHSRCSGAVCAAATLPLGFAATILSGEYLTSWTYLALDLGLAAIGVATGFLIAGRYWPKAASPPQSQAKTVAQLNRLRLRRS